MSLCAALQRRGLAVDRHARAVMQRIARATQHACTSAGLGPPPLRLLVGVSGGADSAAALLALADRAPRYRWDIEAAHFDHGIAPARTRAAFRTAAVSVAARAGVPVHLGSGVPRDPRGRGLEAVARDARYTFLVRLARARDAAAVVVAHTMHDQAETLLLHLLRGSGLDGLGGMASVGPIPGQFSDAQPPLIRPLLSVRRNETEALCRAFAVRPLTDPANTNPQHTRNRIRATLLPRMAEENPRIVEALAALAAGVRDDITALNTLADCAVRTARAPAAAGVPPGAVARPRMREWPPGVRARALRSLVMQAGAPAPSRERTRALEALLDRGGGAVQCEGGVVARARGAWLWVEPPPGAT